MIIPDVNILIHAYDSDSSNHQHARDWWNETLGLERPVGMAWVTLMGFLRISTHRGITKHPLRPGESISRIKSWLANPAVRVVTPGQNHAAILFDLVESVGTAGNLTTDAHLAALSIEYRAEIASTDTDFGRFPGVRWFNPVKLAAKKKTHR